MKVGRGVTAGRGVKPGSIDDLSKLGPEGVDTVSDDFLTPAEAAAVRHMERACAVAQSSTVPLPQDMEHAYVAGLLYGVKCRKSRPMHKAVSHLLAAGCEGYGDEIVDAAGRFAFEYPKVSPLTHMRLLSYAHATGTSEALYFALEFFQQALDAGAAAAKGEKEAAAKREGLHKSAREAHRRQREAEEDEALRKALEDE